MIVFLELTLHSLVSSFCHFEEGQSDPISILEWNVIDKKVGLSPHEGSNNQSENKMEDAGQGLKVCCEDIIKESTFSGYHQAVPS